MPVARLATAGMIAWLARASAFVSPASRPNARPRCAGAHLVGGRFSDILSEKLGGLDAMGVPIDAGAARRRDMFDLDGNGELDPDELELAITQLATLVNAKSTERDIITQFELYRETLWRRWRGTVWEYVWPRLVGFGLYTAACCLLVHMSTAESWDIFTVPAAADVPLVKKLEVVETTWGYISTVTTFTLSFFLNQCYDACAPRRQHLTAPSCAPLAHDRALCAAAPAPRASVSASRLPSRPLTRRLPHEARTRWLTRRASRLCAGRTTFSYARQMQGRLMDMSLSLSAHAQRDAATGRCAPRGGGGCSNLL